MGYEVKGEGKGELSVKDGNCNQDRETKSKGQVSREKVLRFHCGQNQKYRWAKNLNFQL